MLLMDGEQHLLARLEIEIDGALGEAGLAGELLDGVRGGKILARELVDRGDDRRPLLGLVLRARRRGACVPDWRSFARDFK
jgi:hypothetical protein